MDNRFWDREIELVLSQYDRRFQPVDPPTPVSRPGFSAAVWKLNTPAGEQALRCTPERQSSVADLVDLHRLLFGMAKLPPEDLPTANSTFTKPPIAVPHRCADGRSVVETGSGNWQLEHWLPGDPDCSGDPGCARMQSAMRGLALWHVAAASVCRIESSNRFAVKSEVTCPAVTSRLQLLRAWTADRVSQTETLLASCANRSFVPHASETLQHLRRLHRSVITDLQIAAQQRVRIQPVLADCWRDHFLFTGAELTGLIDPHSARTDHVAVDVSRALGTMCPADNRHWSDSIDAYTEIAPFADSDWPLLHVLDVVGTLLGALNWVRWVVVDRIGPANQAVQTLTANTDDERRSLHRLIELNTRLRSFT